MGPIDIDQVGLRDLRQDDLPRLFEFNLDPVANRLAATIPRSAEAFASNWRNALADPNVVAKAICVGDVLAGSICCFERDGCRSVGYWLGRDFWGRGIASRALDLLLKEVPLRTLHAQVATGNRASLRVLEKCGFVIRSVHMSPATDRYLECEEAILILE